MTALTTYLERINPRVTFARALGYDYKLAEVVRVVDGDTLDLRLDLGFHLTCTDRFRVLDVDTPERNQARFAESKLFVEDWLGSHLDLRVTTLKTDSFGRWLAYVYDPVCGADLSADLVHYESSWGY